MKPLKCERSHKVSHGAVEQRLPSSTLKATKMKQQSRNYSNQKEIAAVELAIGYLLRNEDVVRKDIVVLTFYEEQQQLLIDRLKTHTPQVQVYCIDEFQGSEQKIVLVSTVRANAKGNSWVSRKSEKSKWLSPEPRMPSLYLEITRR